MNPGDSKLLLRDSGNSGNLKSRDVALPEAAQSRPKTARPARRARRAAGNRDRDIVTDMRQGEGRPWRRGAAPSRSATTTAHAGANGSADTARHPRERRNRPAEESGQQGSRDRDPSTASPLGYCVCVPFRRRPATKGVCVGVCVCVCVCCVRACMRVECVRYARACVARMCVLRACVRVGARWVGGSADGGLRIH